MIGDEIYNELSYSYYNLEESITPNILALIFVMLMIFSYTSLLRSSSGLFMFIAFIAYICFSVIFIPIAYIIIEDNLGIIEGFSKGFKFGIKNFSSILGVNMLLIIILILMIIIISGGMNIYDESEIISRLLMSILFLIRGIYILKLYNFNKIKTNSTIERSPSELTTNSNVLNQND